MRLGDVATFINGYAFKPSDYSVTGRPIIRIQDLTGNAYETNAFDGTIDDKFLVKSGDILISWSASIDAYYWSGPEAWLNQHIFRVVFDKEDVDKTFFYHQIRHILKGSMQLAHGATMRHLTKKTFDNLEFVLPAKDIQVIQADMLNSVDVLISQLEKRLDLFRSLIKSRFVEMFGDLRDGTGVYPRVRLDEIASTRLGKMLDAKKQTGNHLHPYLGNHNVQWFGFDLSGLSEMDFDEADQVEFALEYGDLLMCEGGEVGRCAVWRNELDDCFYQKAIHRIRCKEGVVLPEYLAWHFRLAADYGLLVRHTNIATIAHLSGVKLKALKILLPPIDLQEQFVGFVSQVDKSEFAVQQAIEQLETLKASLMQEYFG